MVHILSDYVQEKKKKKISSETTLKKLAVSAGAAEYTECISAEG